MFSQLLGFELKFHFKQVGFWITLAIMFLLGVLIMSTDAFTVSDAGERMKANGAIQIALLSTVAGLFSIFFGAIYVVSGVMRDSVHKMLELVHSAPVKTRDMVLARMTGVYVATFVSITALLVGAFAGQFAPWMDKDNLGPVNILYFLQPTLLFIALNTLLISGLFTAVASFTRSRAFVYVSAVALFFLYTGSGLFIGEDANELLLALTDPFGSNALALTVQYWPAAERNTDFAPLLGLIGWNRLLWGAIGIALYVMNFRMFRRGLLSRNSKHEDDTEIEDLSALQFPATGVHSGLLSSLVTLWRRFRFEYVSSVRSVPYMILTALAFGLFSLVVYMQTVYLPNPSIPTSAGLAQIVFGASMIPLLIIMVFFSGDIIWRDRVAGMAEIVDASPSPNWALMLGKWCALITLVLTPLLVGILVAIATQVILHGAPIHLLTYMKIFFISRFPSLVLYSVLVLFIQNFLPNRVLGMLTAGGILVFLFFFMGQLPFFHPLMNYGNLPTGGYSEINGYASLIRFRWFGLYWGSLAVFFTVASAWLWRRGTQSGLWQRFPRLGAKVSPVTAMMAAASLLVFAGSGAWIFKATNVDNEYLNKKQREKRAVAWEKEFDDIRKQVLPKIRKVDLDIDLHPSRQAGKVSGTYVIRNTTGKPLHEVWMVTPTDKVSQMDKFALVGAKQVQDKHMQDIDAKWPNMALFRF